MAASDSFKRYCCAYGCLYKRKNKESGLPFFKIPQDIERQKEWLTAIDREDLLDEENLNKTKNNFVCAAHFDESAIITTITKRLKNDAVPTKLLPYKLTGTHPQTSKDLSFQLSKKEGISPSTYSHTQTQTDPPVQKHRLPTEKEIKIEIDEPIINDPYEIELKSTAPAEPLSSDSQYQTDAQASKQTLPCEKEIRREIAESNIVKPLNELKQISTVLSEPTTSTSQSQCQTDAQAPKHKLPCDKEIKLEIDEPNIDEPDEMKQKSTAPSKPTTCDSQAQTDETYAQAPKHTLPYKKQIRREIAEPNIDKPLNELKQTSTALSEPTTSTSQCQTDPQAPKPTLPYDEEIKQETVEPNIDEPDKLEQKSTAPSEPTTSNLQSQTDAQTPTLTLPYEKEIRQKMSEPNMDEPLNELKQKSTAASKPTRSTSPSQTVTQATKQTSPYEKEIKIKKPEVTSTSTQTDLHETSNKMTQTSLALSNNPYKRQLRKKNEIDKCKRSRLEQEISNI